MLRSRAKILIVDDIAVNIQMLFEALRHDYEIIFAIDGPEALRLALQEQPELILLDVMMPGMDGHAVCRQLKAQPETQSIPVIFVSAMDEDVDEVQGLSLGAVDYLTKPVRIPVARARIRNHIEHKRAVDLLAREAWYDALTGLANRRRFEAVLDLEWRRGARSGATLSVIMIDIDFFKAYNDGYGHGGGDECLRAVAQALSATAQRAADLVARYGGEEFVCVLPDTGLDEARLRAEEMRAQVAELRRPHAFSPVGTVSVSIGVATAVAALDGDRFAVVEAADRQLYAAKAAGRNRICA